MLLTFFGRSKAWRNLAWTPLTEAILLLGVAIRVSRPRQAGLMAEILEETALLQGRNILVDGSMRDGEWYSLHVGDLRERFPRLRVAIIHVSVRLGLSPNCSQYVTHTHT